MSFWSENKVPLAVVGGATLIMAGCSIWSYVNSAHAVDEVALTNSVYSCYCKATNNINCQDTLNKLLGLGLAVVNATLYCGSGGNIQLEKSAAKSFAAWNIIYSIGLS